MIDALRNKNLKKPILAKQVKNNSYLRKNFLTFILIFSLFMMIAVVVFANYTQRKSIETERERYLRISERVVSQLDALLDDMSQLSIYISSAPFSGQEDTEWPLKRKTINELYGFLLPFGVPTAKSQQRISIMNDSGYFFSVGYTSDSLAVRKWQNNSAYQDWYDSLIASELRFLPPHHDLWSHDHYYFPFSFVRTIREVGSLNPIGLISIDQPAAELEQILSSTADEQLYLIDSRGKSMALTRQDDHLDFNELLAKEAFHQNESTQFWQGSLQEGEKTLYIVRPLAQSDWRLLLSVKQTKLLSPINFSLITISMSLFGLYVLLISLAYYFLRKNTKPIIALREQLEKVNIDSLELTLDASIPKDELSLFNVALNDMMKRLQNAADMQAISKTRELHASFLALQAQINPHFLFNILSILSEQAKGSQSTVLSDGLKRLSHMLRYVTQSTPSIVYLEDELKHIEDYLALMKLRFEDQFEYEIYCDNELDRKRIQLPRMSLQPIIENAFSHGFSKTLPPWKISMEMMSSENDWRITIYNNGAGLSPMEMEKLRDRISNFLSEPSLALSGLKIGGMGLVSSISRLDHMYGGSFRYKMLAGADDIGFTLILKGVIKLESSTSG